MELIDAYGVKISSRGSDESIFKYGLNCWGNWCETNWGTVQDVDSIRAVIMSPRFEKALEIHRIASPVYEFDLFSAILRKGNPLDPDNLIRRDFQLALRMAGL